MKKKLFIWIQVIIAATLLGVVVGHVVESLPKSDKKAKYVFLFIGDGMGNSHVATAESYLSYKEGKLGGAKLQMTQFPYYGTATTFSANKVVTCSSAAGTAIACGQKTKNGMVGMDADSVAIYSVAADLRNEGYKVGIVRNHWYDINITSIKGLGTPVFNPSASIDPDRPEEENYYVAAEVKILKWKVVSQNVNLE